MGLQKAVQTVDLKVVLKAVLLAVTRVGLWG